LAKGIRLNQLAKELGVLSKDILEKLRAEGLEDVAPNHQSTVSVGLAETIREWFASGSSGGTAVETAPPPRASKPKATKKKTESSHGEEDPAAVRAEVEHAEPTPSADEATPPEAPAEPAPVTPVVAEPPAPPAVVETPAPVAPAHPPVSTEAPAAPAPVMPAAPVAPPRRIEPPAPAAPLAPAARVETPAPPAPATPPAAHPAPPHAGRPGVSAAPATRPTIRLDSRPPAGGDRKPGAVAAPFVPKPATIQGPKVVREEKPDVVPLPRARRPAPGPGGPAPAFTGTRAVGGRGVRTTEEDDEAEKKRKAAAKGRSLSTRRRGQDGRRGEADEKLREFSEQDLRDRSERLANASGAVHSMRTHLRKSGQRAGGPAQSIVERGDPIYVEEPITVKNLAAALGVKSSDIISRLMRKGVFANINQSLDSEVAKVVALDFGIDLEVARQMTLEEELVEEFDQLESAPEDLVGRPPIVTILGHVDHGKTSLLDRIRSANVAAGEAGGITQHTAAWMVTIGSGDAQKRVTFIDTPGHEAFTAMRARGAHMTDIVVLVVSAAEGVQPQTIESINHARAAEVPIVVAMNKIDRDDANPDMVLGQLAGQGLNPVEWGGDTEVIRTSAVTGQGIENLIEILDLQASIMELKANPTQAARGTVIEARVDPGLGPIATVLVQDGTLRVGDVVLAGNGFGRIRTLLNDLGKQIQEAPPSTPVIISGFSELPGAGDRMFVVEDMDRARSISEERSLEIRQQQLAQQNRVSADNLLDTMASGDIKTINLIVKGDVQGSVETLVATVGGQNTQEVKVKVIHSGVGPISESDVQLAMATKTKPTDNRVSIIGFHVVPDEAARQLAEQNHVEIKLYRVIYEIFDDLKKALSGMLEPEIREKLHGNVEVRQVFKISRLGSIGGCYVTDGHVTRGSKIRLIRDGKIITEDLQIDSLKRVKDDVREVKAGLECGIKLVGYDDIKVGDRLQAYVRETFERTL
jgi:translation initiation factor IF-2